MCRILEADNSRATHGLESGVHLVVHSRVRLGGSSKLKKITKTSSFLQRAITNKRAYRDILTKSLDD